MDTQQRNHNGMESGDADALRDSQLLASGASRRGEIFLNSITEEVGQMTSTYQERTTEWYLNDAHLQKSVTDAIPLPSLVRAKLALYTNDPLPLPLLLPSSWPVTTGTPTLRKRSSRPRLI